MRASDDSDKKPFLDPDLEATDMDELDKWGVQYYRNFSKSIDKHRQKHFVDIANAQDVPIEKLELVQRFMVSEDPRSLPIIFCAFADEQLLEMFSREIPTDVPGGRSELLNGFGSLSRFAQRIQIAYAFGWLSRDLLLEMNLMRRLRNDISHRWELETLQGKLKDLIENAQHKIEKELADIPLFPTNWVDKLSSESRFRVRLVWCLSRVFYETVLWVPAIKAQLSPYEVLYTGEKPPVLLNKVTRLSVDNTKKLIAATEAAS